MKAWCVLLTPWRQTIGWGLCEWKDWTRFLNRERVSPPFPLYGVTTGIKYELVTEMLLGHSADCARSKFGFNALKPVGEDVFFFLAHAN